MDRSLEVRPRAQCRTGREVRRPAVRSHAIRLHQPGDRGGPAARGDSRTARARVRLCLVSRGLQKISRPHRAVLIRTGVEGVRQRMIRALIGILACITIAGCGAQGEPYQPRTTPASQSVIYVYRPYGLLSSQTNPMITCGHDSIELETSGFYEFVADS